MGGKYNLLMYLVDTVNKEYPELADWVEIFEISDETQKIEMDALAKDVNKIDERVKNLGVQLKRMDEERVKFEKEEKEKAEKKAKKGKKKKKKKGDEEKKEEDAAEEKKEDKPPEETWEEPDAPEDVYKKVMVPFLEEAKEKAAQLSKVCKVKMLRDFHRFFVTL